MISFSKIVNTSFHIFNKNKNVGYASSKYLLYVLIHLIVTCLRGFVCSFFYFNGSKVVSIGKKVKFKGPKKMITLDKFVKIEDNVLLHSVSSRGIVISRNATVCNGTQIRPSGYWNGIIGAGLHLGENSSIGANSYIGCVGIVTIGNSVLIGPSITIIAESHNFDCTNDLICNQGVQSLGVVIDDNVWIGANVTILDGVHIGKGSVIGAGAVVNKSIPPNSVAVGVPAKVIRNR